jgi:hypothetical protein
MAASSLAVERKQELREAAKVLATLVRPEIPVVDTIDVSSAALRIKSADVDVSALGQLAGLGGSFRVEVSVDTWRVIAECFPKSSISMATSGKMEDIFGGDELDAVRQAVGWNDLTKLLDRLGDAEAEISVRLANDPGQSGFHWVRTLDALLAILNDGMPGVATMGRLLPLEGKEAVAIVVGEGLDESLRGSRLTIEPAVRDVVVVQPTERPNGLVEYCGRYLRRSPFPLPLPRDVLVDDCAGNILAEALRRMALTAAWCWMASEVDANGFLRFEGARILEVSSSELNAECFDDVLDLWQWAVAASDPDRRDALHRAIAEAGDLNKPRPILRNAKWLLDLARRDAVVEAMSTRRSVRDAAFAAGRAAVDSSTAAAIKAFDRIVLQIGAVAGIVFAQSKALLDQQTAARLIALAGTLTLGFGLASYFLDFPAALAPLKYLETDLTVYRDSLSEDDLSAIKNMDSVVKARQLVCFRRWTSVGVHLIVIGAISYVLARLIGHDVGALFALRPI